MVASKPVAVANSFGSSLAQDVHAAQGRSWFKSPIGQLAKPWRWAW